MQAALSIAGISRDLNAEQLRASLRTIDAQPSQLKKSIGMSRFLLLYLIR